MRALESPRRSWAKLVVVGVAVLAGVQITTWALEPLLIPGVLAVKVQAFYTVRGLALAALMIVALGRLIEGHRRDVAKVDAVFRDFIEHTTEAVIGADQSGRINYANPAAHRIFGHEKLIGRPVTILMPDRYHSAHWQGLVRFLAPPHEHRIIGREQILEGVRQSGHEFPVAITVTAIPGKNRFQFFALLRDLTPLIEAAEDVL